MWEYVNLSIFDIKSVILIKLFLTSLNVMSGAGCWCAISVLMSENDSSKFL